MPGNTIYSSLPPLACKPEDSDVYYKIGEETSKCSKLAGWVRGIGFKIRNILF
jgi:hypothetical protein